MRGLGLADDLGGGLPDGRVAQVQQAAGGRVEVDHPARNIQHHHRVVEVVEYHARCHRLHRQQAKAEEAHCQKHSREGEGVGRQVEPGHGVQVADRDEVAHERHQGAGDHQANLLAVEMGALRVRLSIDEGCAADEQILRGQEDPERGSVAGDDERRGRGVEGEAGPHQVMQRIGQCEQGAGRAGQGDEQPVAAGEQVFAAGVVQGKSQPQRAERRQAGKLHLGGQHLPV
jgi:hypothetical protein